MEHRSAVDWARQGDPNAFTLLIEEYYDKVLKYARKRLRRDQDAEDATQDTFVTAYRSLGSLSHSERSRRQIRSGGRLRGYMTWRTTSFRW